MDTAGIRETSDKIEEIGVNIAQKAIESAELVIAVFDGSEKMSDDDVNIINKINFNNSVAVVNKNVGSQSGKLQQESGDQLDTA